MLQNDQRGGPASPLADSAIHSTSVSVYPAVEPGGKIRGRDTGFAPMQIILAREPVFFPQVKFQQMFALKLRNRG